MITAHRRKSCIKKGVNTSNRSEKLFDSDSSRFIFLRKQPGISKFLIKKQGQCLKQNYNEIFNSKTTLRDLNDLHALCYIVNIMICNFEIILLQPSFMKSY